MKIGNLIRLNDGRRTAPLCLIIKEIPEDHHFCARFEILYSSDTGEAILNRIGIPYANSYYEVVEFENDNQHLEAVK